MTQTRAAIAGVLLSAVLTVGMVQSAMNLAQESPAWTFTGFFQRTIFQIDVLWSRAHGWPSERDCQAAVRQSEETSRFRAKLPPQITAVRAQTRPASAVCEATHIEEFGRFYAHTVEVLCPLLGFALFWILVRPSAPSQLWKPLAAVALAAMLPIGILFPGGLWFEIGRTLAVMLAMLWSVEAFHAAPAAA